MVMSVSRGGKSSTWRLSEKTVMVPMMVMVMVVVVAMCFGRAEGTFELTILHTNDIHARFDQTNARSGECSSENEAEGKCYGGYPRLHFKVEELRHNYSNVVLVDAGDQFQGTLWFYTYGENITVHFMNRMKYDIMALGNHEFDLGPEVVEKFVSEAAFPVLSSNTDASAYPGLASLLNGSHVLVVGGQQVGFVGYTTVETAAISLPGKVTFTDELEAIRREVGKLVNAGVNKIVCVGHAGYVKDLVIAREVAGVDVVVGGHTNTFLYTGVAPDSEKPVDDYPTVVTQSDGRKVLVVQDYAFGKYLGFLQVTFDDDGVVTKWSGNPILLNNLVPRDEAMLQELEVWGHQMKAQANRTVGYSAVLLVGDRLVCRLQECNLGNLITDAMVMQNIRHSDSSNWNHVAIAITNSGGIRATLEKGDITVADVLLVNPFRSTIDIIEITGKTLRATMEHSASQWNPRDARGGFLQHSGLRVLYDMKRPEGSRVVTVQVRCADCQVPVFEPLDDNKVYKVVISSFLAEGGDSYSVISKNIIKRHLNGDLDSDVLTDYITKYSPLIQGLEGRIRFVHSTSSSVGVTCRLTSLPVLVVLTVVARALSFPLL